MILSHVGIPRNEEYDRATRQAMSNGDIYYCLPLHTKILSDAKVNCRHLWHEYFDEKSLTKA